MKAKTFSNRLAKPSLGIIMLLAISFTSLFAQEDNPTLDTTRKDAIRLFLDCRWCDMEYLKKEIPYVNYVRDIKEAQVYLLLTDQTSGSGGYHTTLFYSGQQEFVGMKDTLSFDVSPDETEDMRRDLSTRIIAMGLMRYVAKTPIKNNVAFSYIGQVQEKAEQVADKWDNWVFEIQTMPRFSLTKSQKSFSWGNNITLNRVTPEWKFENTIKYDYARNRYIREIIDSETEEITEIKTTTKKESWSYNNLTVKSLSDHWSAGFKGLLSYSTFSNLDLKVSAAPAIEYDIFPYSESTHKQLRILYSPAFIYNNYIDTTIYDKAYERLFQQSLDIAMEIQQSWGSASFSLNASNYLHDWEKYMVKLEGRLQWRIFKGLSVNLDCGMSFIHNQIELAKGNRSAEDVYLSLRELESNYNYSGRIGLTYTFGSIYNNIVNPRFGSSQENYGFYH
jgi:hypothetical protein